MQDILIVSIVCFFAGYQIGYRVGFKHGDNAVFTDPNYHKKKLSKVIRSHFWAKYKFKSVNWTMVVVYLSILALGILGFVLNWPFE